MHILHYHWFQRLTLGFIRPLVAFLSHLVQSLLDIMSLLLPLGSKVLVLFA